MEHDKLREIERINNRGGHTPNIADLIQARMLKVETAGYTMRVTACVDPSSPASGE